MTVEAPRTVELPTENRDLRLHLGKKMASKALNKSSRILRYFPDLRAVVSRTRLGPNVASAAALSTSTTRDKLNHTDSPGLASNWSDRRLGPFTPRDPNFPLPGNMGLDPSQRTHQDILSPQPVQGSSRKTLAEAFLEVESDTAKKSLAMETFLSNLADQQEIVPHNQVTTQEEIKAVECSIQQCPVFLHRGFMELFPNIGVEPGQLTAVSISQRSKNDMSTWSPDVEDEREDLLRNFIESAKEICSNLKAAGYWADFIDPASGTAFFGPHTNTTLFETDERYNHLGFQVLDLGCCKVISHHLWGTHAFIGSIFTNAPAESHALSSILEH